MNINIVKLNEDAVTPQFAHESDTGFDLFTSEDTYIAQGEKQIIKTGLIFEIPFGWGVQIKNKSGITMKGVPIKGYEDVRADITVYEGTIDNSYRGEIGIMVKNEEEFPIIIPKHTKIAQGVLRKVYHCTFNEVDKVSDTIRGKGGFGSTGVGLEK